MMAVRAPRAASRGARSGSLRQRPAQRAGQRFAHDLLDGPGTTAALGRTSETTIDFLGRTDRIRRGGHGCTNVVVAQHVAGTNNHDREMSPVIDAYWIFIGSGRSKRKSANLQRFQTTGGRRRKPKWNDSKLFPEPRFTLKRPIVMDRQPRNGPLTQTCGRDFGHYGQVRAGSFIECSNEVWKFSRNRSHFLSRDFERKVKP